MDNKTNKKDQIIFIKKIFTAVTKEFLCQGIEIKNLKEVVRLKNDKTYNKLTILHLSIYKKCILTILLSFIISIFFYNLSLNFSIHFVFEKRCFIPNNYFVWEFTRPVSNCDYCRGVINALIMNNLTREEFAPYAYSSKPMIIKNAARTWKASKMFNLNFFNNLYESIDGAYESIEDECQFLHFKSNFSLLKQVLTMSKQQASNYLNKNPWYVGWKNCHPQVLDVMKKYYDSPHFLPLDTEIPQTNYIFIGYDQGANMHLDYIPRLMWQGQLAGKKIWSVAPTPECDSVCKRFNFSVDTGDIVLLDTRVWYHATLIKDNTLSLTITSEYG
ncbi:uncharacterized protein LOC123263394 [Cotesia glomerata]|uniref:Uncharacterized protein n=1 Tax=Cotesia glomerata TaxID=32391 RepID=A0AAV7IL48_COTGL|nr:uncharacterized protein LOC123263394 [Cotesia glomerata]KAH0554393.1 hypothetical protein KQX54_010289 [Cotesia glomerata]